MGIKLIANLIKKSIFMVMQLSIINVALSFNHQLFNRGTFRNGKMINGRFKFQNGYQYWGELSGKKFMGKGTFKCPDQKVITGVWKGWNVVGRAQMEYPSGDVYYGQIKDFKKHGDGYLFFKSGNKYIGQFENGKIHGLGIYFEKEQLVLKGTWNQGEFVEEKNLQQMEEKMQAQTSSNDFALLNRNGFFSFLQDLTGNSQIKNQVINSIKEEKNQENISIKCNQNNYDKEQENNNQQNDQNDSNKENLEKSSITENFPPTSTISNKQIQNVVQRSLRTLKRTIDRIESMKSIVSKRQRSMKQ